MTAKVVGADLSYSGTGIAEWCDGLWNVATIRTGSHLSGEQRRSDIRNAIVRRVTPGCLFVIEAPLLLQRPGTLELAMLHGVVRDGLHACGVPFALVVNNHLKQFATGRGNAGKQEMLDACAVRLGMRLYDDNQADAMLAAAMGLHRYGRPLCATTAVQNEAVRQGSWPDWSLEAVPA